MIFRRLMEDLVNFLKTMEAEVLKSFGGAKPSLAEVYSRYEELMMRFHNPYYIDLIRTSVTVTVARLEETFQSVCVAYTSGSGKERKRNFYFAYFVES